MSALSASIKAAEKRVVQVDESSSQGVRDAERRMSARVQAVVTAQTAVNEEVFARRAHSSHAFATHCTALRVAVPMHVVFFSRFIVAVLRTRYRMRVFVAIFVSGTTVGAAKGAEIFNIFLKHVGSIRPARE